jgi:hypothetical protein
MAVELSQASQCHHYLHLVLLAVLQTYYNTQSTARRYSQALATPSSAHMYTQRSVSKTVCDAFQKPFVMFWDLCSPLCLCMALRLHFAEFVAVTRL